MLYIKHIENQKYNNAQATLLPWYTPVRIGVTWGQTSTSFKNGHVAYNIEGNEMWNNMQRNT